MPQLIKDNAVVNDEWQIIPKDHDGELPGGKLILPLELWLEQKDSPGEAREVAPWIDSDEEIEPVAEQVTKAPLIAVNFPKFSDGRGFSTGRLLRERYGYKSELRAIGHVIRDQLFYLKRCGFNAYDLREGTDLEAALESLEDFSDSYQAGTDNPAPLFRRRS